MNEQNTLRELTAEEIGVVSGGRLGIPVRAVDRAISGVLKLLNTLLGGL